MDHQVAEAALKAHSALRGELLAMRVLIEGLIATNPYPEALKTLIDGWREEVIAQMLGSTGFRDEALESFHAMYRVFEEAIALRLQYKAEHGE